MGSGCTSSSPKKYCPTPVSSNCVEYVGEPVPLLGICTGDTITEVEKAIIDKLLEVLNGTGIVLSAVTLDNCQYLKTMFAGKDKTLDNLVQLLVDSECNLKALIDQINAKLTPTGNNFVFDLKCVNVPTPPSGPITSDHVLQGTINTLCALKSQVDALTEVVNNIGNVTNDATGNFLKGAINGCTGIKKTGSGATVQIDLIGMVPPFSAVFSFAPLSWFDNSGKGLPETPACNWFICNGNNGTPDMRGFVPVGAIQGVPGPALDPIVDPSGDATMNYQVNVAGGSAKKALTANNIPAHTHTINETPHKHNILGIRGGDNDDNNNTTRFAGGDKNQGESGFYFTNTEACQPTSTGITINPSVGGNQPIDVRQPFKGGNFIMRFE